VHSTAEARARLFRLDRPAGAIDCDLTFGLETIRLEGLSAAFAAVLEERWGGFLAPPRAASPRLVVRNVRGDGSPWLPPWKPGEGYRLEADAAGGPLIVRSYHFALGREPSGSWRLAVEDRSDEPVGRVFDNAARYLVARIALDQGGLPLHGAGVMRNGRGFVFARASGAGKSTAVRLSAPAASLGDDFAIVLPRDGDWVTAALPFDNAETAPREPVRGLVPLAGVYRLFQATTHRIERPAGALAQVSLLACMAFPWALADLADRAGESVARLSASGRFAHLHFAPDPGFWPLLEDAA
jgi:hypothetical protein